MNDNLDHAVRKRAIGGVREAGTADLEAMKLGIWTQMFKGLNWMLGRRDLT